MRDDEIKKGMCGMVIFAILIGIGYVIGYVVGHNAGQHDASIRIERKNELRKSWNH